MQRDQLKLRSASRPSVPKRDWALVPSAGRVGKVAILRLVASEASRLKMALSDPLIAQLLSVCYDDDPAGFESTCAALLDAAAPRLVAACHQIVEACGGLPEMMVVEGGWNFVASSAAELPPTPIDGVIVQSEVTPYVLLLVGVMRHTGYRGAGYHTENRGKLLRSVSPVWATNSQPSSQGARGDLDWHSDQAALRIPASSDSNPYMAPVANRFQGFVVVRPLDGVPIQAKLVSDILARLDPGGGPPNGLAAYEALLEPGFRIKMAPSHIGGVDIGPLPLLVRLNQPVGHLGLRYHGQLMTGDTPQAREALALFKDAISRTPAQRIALKPGLLVIYDNATCIHSRESFEAKFDSTDRFLIRLYGVPEGRVDNALPLLSPDKRVMGVSHE